MKDIKFRQRDNDGNWHYWGYIDGSFIGPMSKNHASEKNYQYTGLKDKNGVEIYEGDIVKTDYDNGFDVLTHTVKWCGPSYPAFELLPRIPCEANNFSHIYECDDTTIEVIGNIYENPELLRSKPCQTGS